MNYDSILNLFLGAYGGNVAEDVLRPFSADDEIAKHFPKADQANFISLYDERRQETTSKLEIESPRKVFQSRWNVGRGMESSQNLTQSVNSARGDIPIYFETRLSFPVSESILSGELQIRLGCRGLWSSFVLKVESIIEKPLGEEYLSISHCPVLLAAMLYPFFSWGFTRRSV